MKQIIEKLRKKLRGEAAEVFPGESSSAEAGRIDPQGGGLNLICNGREVSRGEWVAEVGRLLEPRQLKSSGGVLFKAGIDADTLFFGVIANFSGGERGYHYEIRLPREDAYTLIGGISVQQELSILFKNRTVNDEARAIYRRVYRELVQLLLEASGYRLVFDSITVQLIREAELFSPVPADPRELISFRQGEEQV
jgi:hypothetical protein